MASIQDIFKWVEMFNQTTPPAADEATEAYIARLLQSYDEKLHSLPACPVQSQGDWDNTLIDVKLLSDTINKCLNHYSQARIADSINLLHEYIAHHDGLLKYTVNPSVEADKIWYRMRMQEKGHRVFPAKEMFHIPFNLRHKVSLARYSVSGYPCLYISRSVWANWEEMHEPKISDFTVSRLELQNPINVLDLRVPVWREDYSDQDLLSQLVTIPLVLACSVKTRYPDDNFRSEYIVPQLVMLAITYPDVEVMGCAYTSTMRNPVFTWPDVRLLDNLALPVKKIDTAIQHCPVLCSLFKISDSTNYDFEMLKEPFATLFWSVFDEEGIVEGAKEYSSSIFGQLEERLAEMEVKQL